MAKLLDGGDRLVFLLQLQKALREQHDRMVQHLVTLERALVLRCQPGRLQNLLRVR